jgi:hypothetical protein
MMNTSITERFCDYYFSTTLKRPLVPHVRAKNVVKTPITDICLYFEGKEPCPDGFTPTNYVFKRTFVGLQCRLGIKRDPDTPPLVDIRFLRSGSSLPARMKEYEVIKKSKKLKLTTQLRISGRFLTTYAYIVYKRQRLQRGSLLHRESPIEDICVVHRNEDNTVPHNYEAVKSEGKINIEKAQCWLYVSRGVADGLLDMAFDPAIYDRVPAIDHKDFEFPENMEHFCFPHGIRFVLAREQEIPMPRWSMFVLTQADGTRVYGACVKFYEMMTSEEIDWLEEQYVF